LDKEEVSLHGELPMDRSESSLAEIEMIGTLIKRVGTNAQRTELVRTLENYAFVEPEHRIVFESIRFLVLRDTVSKEKLAVHLNNCGFPDVDLDKYIAAGNADIEPLLQLAARLNSAGQERIAGMANDGGKTGS
jgi:hypothetical protein